MMNKAVAVGLSPDKTFADALGQKFNKATDPGNHFLLRLDPKKSSLG